MTLEAECPQGHRLRITEAHLGKQVCCSVCGTTFVVPKLGAQPAHGPGPAEVLQADTGGAPGVAGRLPRMPNLPRLGASPLVVGRPMMLVGLLLVLVSRGCYSVGHRGVARAQQKARMARNQFDDAWDAKAIALQRELEALDEKKEPSPDDVQRRSELRSALSDLAQEREKARELLESGEWRELSIAARDAAAEHEMHAYWYEMFFVFASLLLTAGLLVVSWNAQGAERLVCLIILAIIAFSVYVGGIAWVQIPIG